MFIRDEGSAFDAPLAEVWAFLGSGDVHSRAHRHTEVLRVRLEPELGTYAWTQPFRGAATRFTMRWRTYPPLGIAYEVLEGPFAGSSFFLYYEPLGARTGVSVVGEFVSETLPPPELETAVREFFALEFEQDRAAIEGRGRR